MVCGLYVNSLGIGESGHTRMYRLLILMSEFMNIILFSCQEFDHSGKHVIMELMIDRQYASIDQYLLFGGQ